MIIKKLAAVGLLGMVAVSALAQAPAMNTFDNARAGPDNRGRDSLLRSDKASNTVSANTSETSAPTLPSPALSLDASSHVYPRAAREALSAGHTREAQQSLEMAETRASGGSDSPNQAKLPSGKPHVAEITDALCALGNGDRAHAIKIIDIALSN